MKKRLIISILTLLGAVIGSILFWSEYWGINTLLFSGILLGLLAYAQPESLRFRHTRVIVIGMLLSSLMVTWHNHAISKNMYAASVFLLIGFVQQREIRFLYYGILLSLSGFFEVPARYIRQLRQWRGFGGGVGQFLYWLKIVIFPLIITTVFMGIYAGANPKFAELTGGFIGKLLEFIFALFNWDVRRFFLFLFCLCLILAITWSNSRLENIYTRALRHQFPLLRQRRKENNKAGFGMSDLKSEYRIGIVSLVLLNLLLLLVNATDMQFVWLQYESFSAAELRQFVHTGTYALILAILMAMALLLYFFRKNLNFYPNNALLKQLAYAWITQNAVLAFSVGIRNFHYVQHYGLT